MATGLIVPPLHAQDFTFTTIAGGAQGSADGVNASAQFYNPTAVAADGGGNVYVADQNNNLIRKITPLGTNWIVTTLAGGAPGSSDGANGSAQFSGPSGIAVDGSGNLYVADQYNSVIRRITHSGTNWDVTTIAGKAGVTGSQNGANGAARFSNPVGIAVDGAGNLFVADELNNAIRKITPAGTNWIVTTIAGGTQGASDGANTAAQFFSPSGVAVDAGGRVFVADQFNNTIRLITPVGTNWEVTTIAGQSDAGSSDGLGANAYFNTPISVAVDTNDNVYVADLFNNAIRILVPSGTNWAVSTIAGGSQGTNDGTGANARFSLPFGVAADAFGDVFVADSQNNAIRLGVSSTSLPPTGGLEVTIVPSSAVTNGAQWQVDGGVFQSNGAILSGLVPGDHTISFSSVAGFTTPAAQTVPVTARQTALATGNYPVAIANAGSLQVIVSPVGAVLAGAQWRVDYGTMLLANAAIVAGLSVGTHTISFSGLPGWTTPVSQTITITNGQTTLAQAIYVLQTGSLQVTILPGAVVTVGAKWQVDGGTSHASGATLSGLLPGSHTVSFNTALGWSTPADRLVTITNGQTTTNTAIYAQQISGTGALQVNLFPSGAVTAGAQWHVDGGSAQSNGTIASGLTPGSHTVIFTAIPGYNNPPDQTVAISDNQVTLAIGTYVASAGSLQVTITPADAVAAGAQWVVDGGSPQTNGTIVSGLTPGNHTVVFTIVPGFSNPSDQIVTITNLQTTLAVGTYLASAGSLRVTITPAGAVTNGAQWQVDGGAFQASGVALASLAPGTHTVAFKIIPKWIPPIQQLVTITAGQATSITNAYRAGTDTTKPRLAITNGPLANAHLTSPLVVYKGNASDTNGVDQVLFQLNNAGYQPAVGTTNWSASLTLIPGANIFTVKATDASGNITVLSRTNYFIVPSLLTVTTNGSGRITPVLNRTNLDVGMPYLLTAAPNAGNLFSNWSGSLTSTNPALHFTMQSNMVLHANFVPNPFIPQQGVFSGLFYDTSGVARQSSGFFNLTLAQKGSFSINTKINGGSYSATGQFDLTGHSHLSVPRAHTTTLAADLQLDFSNHLSGAISDGTWNAVLNADRAVFNATNNKATNFIGQYTMAIAAPGDGSASPGGDGYATFSVNAAGAIVMAGSLADGTAISQSVSLSGDGQWPLYVALTNGGSALSWITFSNQPASTLGGALMWIRPAGSSPKLYTAGFTNLTPVTVTGSRYRVTNGVPVLALDNGQTVLSGSSLGANLTNAISINTNNTLKVTAGAEHLTLVLTNKVTGLITGSFHFPGTGTVTPVRGVILQGQDQAQGYFLGSTQSGAFLIQSQ